MPPFLIAAAGLMGAVALTRFVLRESRRVSAKVDIFRTPPGTQEDTGIRLERDPVTGAYRPRAGN
ncbi:hypothetical protein [Aquabacter cavernae]|uniref:hypothetical protein n=1 Tax=Aquabacter cavernae TaxID=2496029 RepID=UPI000F8D8DE0|nr:hypothetical protein [Aquabacter cavernae]